MAVPRTPKVQRPRRTAQQVGATHRVRKAAAVGGTAVNLIVRLMFMAVLGSGGVIATVIAVTIYGDWRSSQSSLGLLVNSVQPNSTPQIEYVTWMVIAALVAVACFGCFVIVWVHRPRRRRRPVVAGNRVDQLARLSELHRAGEITDAEFETEKRHLLQG
jgi:hypothetical protein